MIHNVFSENLLTRCVELKFKEQHEEPVPPINEEEEYEVEQVRKHRKHGRVT